MKTLPIILFCLFILTYHNLYGQVGIGTNTPASSAILDITSTNKGMLLPRMTSAERMAINSPATGLLVFDTTTGSFLVFNNSTWLNLSDPGQVTSYIADADNNTKVQTEKNPNEDIIRFDLGGWRAWFCKKR